MLYFIYGLVDPTLVDETSDGVGYVGITNNPNRRLLEHTEMRGVDGVKNGWIRYLLDNNIYPKMKILEIVDGDMEAARIREMYWVQHYQERNTVLANHQKKIKAKKKDAIRREASTPRVTNNREMKQKRIQRERVRRANPPPGYYTAMQAAERLGVGSGMLRFYVREGKIEHFIPPGRKQGFYKQEDVDRLAREFNDERKKLFEWLR
jgi:MerR HTH family regulatory protein/GIY-YIG catalytic domain